MNHTLPRTARRRGADVIAEVLANAGIGHVFGVGGANIEDLYDALGRRAGIEPVLAKHEFSAGTMADGYARVGGGIGAVMTTSGGGALNVIPALGESFTSRVPVIALVGLPPQQIGGGSFQDMSGLNGSINAESIFSAVSKRCVLVKEAGTLREQVRAALEEAVAVPAGPVVLLLPKDVQQEPVPAERRIRSVLHVSGTSGSSPEGISGALAAPTASAASIEQVSATLAEASRNEGVVVIAGDAVGRHGLTTELEALVSALDARIAVTPDGRDAFANADPRFLGVTGTMGHEGVAQAVADASACLVIGTRLPLMARHGLDAALRKTTVISLGDEAPHLPSLHIVGVLGDTLSRLSRRLVISRRLIDAPLIPDPSSDSSNSGTPPGTGLPDAGSGLTNASDPPNPRLDTSLNAPQPAVSDLGYAEIIDTIREALGPSDDVFVDAGNTGAAAIHGIAAPEDGRFVVALGMGGMGYSFGAGIGGAFARADEALRSGGAVTRREYVIAGDGSFFMHGLEIHTAVEHRLPITFVIVNNNAHAMCLHREQAFLGATAHADSYNRFQPTAIGAAVSALLPGINAQDATSLPGLKAALHRAAEGAGPALVSIECDAEQEPPFSGLGARSKAGPSDAWSKGKATDTPASHRTSKEKTHV